MYVLSLTPLWAWAFIHGPKDIENRRWVNKVTHHLIDRGLPFAVHTTQAITHVQYCGVKDRILSIAPELEGTIPKKADLILGAVIGLAYPTGILKPASMGPLECWHFPDQYGWICKRREALSEPLTVKGRQGFWSLPDAVINERRAA